ncbi:MAG: co-chaperone GroES [Nitrosopumilus sp.]
MKARPLQNRIIVRPIEAQDKSPGGIIVPEMAKEKPLEGRVLAVGVKVEEVHVSDIITYSKYAGTELKLEDEEEVCLILSEDDVLAVLE